MTNLDEKHRNPNCPNDLFRPGLQGHVVPTVDTPLEDGQNKNEHSERQQLQRKTKEQNIHAYRAQDTFPTPGPRDSAAPSLCVETGKVGYEEDVPESLGRESKKDLGALASVLFLLGQVEPYHPCQQQVQRRTEKHGRNNNRRLRDSVKDDA